MASDDGQDGVRSVVTNHLRQTGAAPPESAVGWLVELSVAAGQSAAFEALTGEMVDSARGESGTLLYGRFARGGASNIVHCLEAYATSEAACSHLDEFAARFADRFLTLVSRNWCFAYGPMSAQLRSRLVSLNPTYLPVGLPRTLAPERDD